MTRPVDPGREASDFQAAAQYHRAGDRASALQLCDRLLGGSPSKAALPAILNLKAVILAEQGRLMAAAECIERAVDASPGNAALHEHAARICAGLGRLQQAERHAITACEAAPGAPGHRYQLARIRRRNGDVAGAIEAAKACLAAEPGFDEAWILRSELATDQADPPHAAACLERVVERRPDHVRAWSMLAAMAPELTASLPVDDALVRLAAAGGDADTAATAQFALADRALRRGEHARAFEGFRAANELRATDSPFDIAGWEARVARTLARNATDALPSAGSEDSDPEGARLVFVVGMPRSGTSLCEQVLSAHPDVFGAGELQGMEAIRAELAARGVDPERPDAHPDWLAPMRRAYLQGLPEQSARHARVIDKAPRNFERIALIWRLFPAARIVWMLRHPLDTVLSCYFQDFGPGQAFSNSLDHAARVYLGHARLLRHWLVGRRGRILPVHYGDLVTQLERTARAMADFLGIGFVPEMLRPERNPRRVLTASSEQVRIPVHSEGLGRWRAFEAELGAVRAFFEAHGLLAPDGTSRLRDWLAGES